MSEDDVDNFVLRHLRQIDTKVDWLIDDIRDNQAPDDDSRRVCSRPVSTAGPCRGSVGSH